MGGEVTSADLCYEAIWEDTNLGRRRMAKTLGKRTWKKKKKRGEK